MLTRVSNLATYICFILFTKKKKNIQQTTYTTQRSCLLKRMVLPLIWKTEMNFKYEKMLKFTQFFKFTRF